MILFVPLSLEKIRGFSKYDSGVQLNMKIHKIE